MKRYRILSFDFDSRAYDLEPPRDQWSDKVKEQHAERRANIIRGLEVQFGKSNLETKVENFRALKPKPFSVAAFHNKFLDQIRSAFVVGGYYPALTGACALGERILNHMMLLLRNHHQGSSEYKKLYRKQSFDQWPPVIDALESWGELLPDAAKLFRELNEKRNRAIHFNPETDHNDKELALEAIHIVQKIVSTQFSAFGNQPWFFCVPGEIYIKKEWEEKPLVKHIFIPNSLLVGPDHRIVEMVPKIVVKDHDKYEDREITDEEYHQLRAS